MKSKTSKFLLLTFSIVLSVSMSGCTHRDGNSTSSLGEDSTVQMEDSELEAFIDASIPEEEEDTFETEESSETILIVYYSHSNNTAEVAGQIHELVGGDLFRITPVDPYPTDYEEHIAQVADEIEQGYLPPLNESLDNLDSYEVIYLGYPMWYRDLALPVKTFLSEYDLSGKTVIPFCTHQGTGAEESTESLRTLLPNATILELFDYDTYNRGTDGAPGEVAAWLERLGVMQDKA